MVGTGENRSGMSTFTPPSPPGCPGFADSECWLLPSHPKQPKHHRHNRHEPRPHDDQGWKAFSTARTEHPTKPEDGQGKSSNVLGHRSTVDNRMETTTPAALHDRGRDDHSHDEHEHQEHRLDVIQRNSLRTGVDYATVVIMR